MITVEEEIERRRKRKALKEAESKGEIADSFEVRSDLMRRAKAGKITLKQSQALLEKIKRNAKKNGKLTQDQKWRCS